MDEQNFYTPCPTPCTLEANSDEWWIDIFLILLIDLDTWTFPEWLKIEPLAAHMKALEQNTALRNVMQSLAEFV